MNNSNPTGRNHIEEDDDALVREIQQRPLPPQKSQQLYLDNKRRSVELEFDNSDRVVSVERD